jgi:hypothetical protein
MELENIRTSNELNDSRLEPIAMNEENKLEFLGEDEKE